MKVLIVGLGLMGGAYAYKLKNAGYEVFGVDINPDSINYAIKNDYVISASNEPADYIKDMDLIILALYPTQILTFLRKYHDFFNENQLITDISGVKSSYLIEANTLAKPAKYLAHHPMAGREKKGIEYSHLCNFSKANFIITPVDFDDKNIKIIEKIGHDLGFGHVKIIDYKTHDDMIGFTSQLAHAMAVSLVNADKRDDTKDFVGDSYRDLTRIAMINEELWSELFLENKDFLLKHITNFEEELDKIKNAIKDNDKDKLKELFIKSSKKRNEMV